MANKPTQIDGTVPVIPTPFRKDESIDLEAVASCVRFAADCGVTAVCLPAYGSEFYKLSEVERFQVLEAAVGAADDRVLIIGQSNHPATVRAIEIAKKNEALGADIISFALPRLFDLTENDLLQYAWQLAKSGSEKQAMAIYEKVLPQIVFSLQNFELFTQIEKDLLVRRGVIPLESAHSRSATYTPDEHSWQYGQKLNERIVEYAQ